VAAYESDSSPSTLPTVESIQGAVATSETKASIRTLSGARVTAGGVLLWGGTVAVGLSTVVLLAVLSHRLHRQGFTGLSTLFALFFIASLIPSGVPLRAAALEVDGAPPMRMRAVHVVALAAVGVVVCPPLAYALKLPVLAVLVVWAQVMIAIPLSIRRGSLLASRRFDAMGGNLLLEGGARVVLGTVAGLWFGLVGLSAGIALATAVAFLCIPRQVLVAVRTDRKMTSLLHTWIAMVLLGLFVQLDILVAPNVMTHSIATRYDLAAVPSKGVYLVLAALSTIIFPYVRVNPQRRIVVLAAGGTFALGLAVTALLVVLRHTIAATLGQQAASEPLLIVLGIAMSIAGATGIVIYAGVAFGVRWPWPPLAFGMAAILAFSLTDPGAREFGNAVLIAEAATLIVTTWVCLRKSSVSRATVPVGQTADHDRVKTPAEDFAAKNNSFPILTPGDVLEPGSSIVHAGDDDYSSDQMKANVIRIGKRKDPSVAGTSPDAWNGDTRMASSGGIANGPYPLPQGAPDTSPDSHECDETMSRSPTWETVDEQAAADAAVALMQAAVCIRAFAQHQTQEVEAFDDHDRFDSYAAQQALCSVSEALGVVAQLALHEGLAAAKTPPDGETVEETRRRLSGKTIDVLAAARDNAKELADHLTGVLGDLDPVHTTAGTVSDDPSDVDSDLSDGDKELPGEDIDEMMGEELIKLLYERDEARRVVHTEANESKKDKTEQPEAEAPSYADKAHNYSKKKNFKVEDTRLEDEADDDDNDGGKGGRVKTPAEIEADQAVMAARKEVKRAKKAAKLIAKQARVARAIEEARAEAAAMVRDLQAKVDEISKQLDLISDLRMTPSDVQKTQTDKDLLALRIEQLLLIVQKLDEASQ
jgi:hypothetical protein